MALHELQDRFDSSRTLSFPPPSKGPLHKEAKKGKSADRGESHNSRLSWISTEHVLGPKQPGFNSGASLSYRSICLLLMSFHCNSAAFWITRCKRRVSAYLEPLRCDASLKSVLVSCGQYEFCQNTDLVSYFDPSVKVAVS